MARAAAVDRLCEGAVLGRTLSAGLARFERKGPLEAPLMQLLDAMAGASELARLCLFSAEELLQMLRLLKPQLIPDRATRSRQVKRIWDSLQERFQGQGRAEFDWLELEGCPEEKEDGKGEKEEEGAIVLLLRELKKEEGGLEVAQRFEKSVRSRPLELALARAKGLL